MLARSFGAPVAISMIVALVLLAMALPVPSIVVDFGLAISFAVSILILSVSLFIAKPSEFSSFPLLIVGSLLLRLSLSVASTKLIIGNGHTGTSAAGGVIEGFANFVMAGNLYIGLSVFLVITAVNFMVITKGAGRMAEVGARFALDGLPGKQMAIDADLSSGAITASEATARRERELAEINFFGSLDGVSKFVRGDAIIGIIIAVVNLFVGVIVGVLLHGMSISSAFEVYTILTIGDGLVGQLPAVIVSVASALLLSRGGGGAIDGAIIQQINGVKGAPLAASLFSIVLAFLPGMPTVPFLLTATVLLMLSFRRKKKKEEILIAEKTTVDQANFNVGDILDFDEIHVEFSRDLVSIIIDKDNGMDGRIRNIRRYFAMSFGLIIPEIRLTDNDNFSRGMYRVHVQNVEAASGNIFPEKCLLLLSENHPGISGEDVHEPVYGAKARWIRSEDREVAILGGGVVVDALEVLSTHLVEIIRLRMSDILSLRGLRKLLDEFSTPSNVVRAESNRRLLSDIIPEKVSIENLHSILKLLLEERVSIRNIPLILEALSEVRGSREDFLYEHVRLRLSAQILSTHRMPDGGLQLIQLSPDWDKIFDEFEVMGVSGEAANRGGWILPAESVSKLVKGVSSVLSSMEKDVAKVVLVVSSRRRFFIRSSLKSRGVDISVLSYDEVAMERHPNVLGLVSA